MPKSTEFIIQLDNQDIEYLGTIKGDYESLEHALEGLIHDSLVTLQNPDLKSLGAT